MSSVAPGLEFSVSEGNAAKVALPCMRLPDIAAVSPLSPRSSVAGPVLPAGVGRPFWIHAQAVMGEALLARARRRLRA